ncbi:hypothetical protein PVL29_007761 [Vitis rotundifolia]|uniref:Pentatricopeptide repeat-containing protein n=1 Tax=Vitis rotundifolia TaxID=103349 RepID=A0AA39A0Y9_VITRO|nr:hypothetical protein PVL29_007761 [Vitis rotundifolia]
MAVTPGLSVKLGASSEPSFLRCHSPNNRISNNKARVSNATLSCSRDQKFKGVGRGKVCDPSYTAKTDQYHESHEAQELVDLLRDSVAKGSIREGKSVHGLLLKSSFGNEESIRLFNHVTYMYAECSCFVEAWRVFDGMPHRNAFSWTVMIVGSKKNGLFLDGFRFFYDMLVDGILPDEFVYSAVIQSCIGLGCIELGEAVHGQIVKRGFWDDVIVGTSLLSMYAKLHNSEASVRVFNAIAEHNQVSWGAVISGLSSNGLYLEAFHQFLAMITQGFTPNMYTFSSVLKAVGKMRDATKGREVHQCVMEYGMESNVVVGTSLIDMYSKCGHLSDARSVFDRNFYKSKVNNPWNAMISGYTQCGYWQEALDLFIEMCLNDVKPDLYTYGGVFSAIAALKWLYFGRQVHGMVVKSGNGSRVLSLNNAIVDAYFKCQSLEDARKVFDRMQERDMVSWTTLVSAYVQCYQAREALSIFSQMREQGFMPNQFTFSSVLVACASLSLLEYGRQVHGLICKAGLDDDNCIESSLTNMYAKSGNIIDAVEVFEKIVCPDVVSWSAIIYGYAQHGFLDKAIELVQKMEQSGIQPNSNILLTHLICL